MSTNTNGIKISNLPVQNTVTEGSLIPVTLGNDTLTGTIPLTSLRQALGFENAYATIAAGVAGTVNQEPFFVYDSPTKDYVLGYINYNGSASPYYDANNTQLRLPTNVHFKRISGLTEPGGSSLIQQSSGVTISAGVGEWLPSTTAIFTQTAVVQTFQTRGFYTSGDGGNGTWNATGVTNLARAGTHVITEGKVYNANGVEYLFGINGSIINPLANGLLPVTATQAVAATENFTCLGQCLNGIFSQLPIPVYSNNSEQTYTGVKNLRIQLPPNMYRIGKNAHSIYNFTTYDLRGSKIWVFASPSNTFAATGVRLNGFQHGYDEIKAKWNAVGQKAYWGSVSLQHVNFLGGHLLGDLNIAQPYASSSAGCGILVINPEYFYCDGTHIQKFNWCCVVKAGVVGQSIWNDGTDFDNNVTDYKYICDFMGSSRFGNFYGANFNNCTFTDGWRGVFRSDVDWSCWRGGICTSGQHWGNATTNLSGMTPSYTMVVTGTGFQAHGAYLSNNGGMGEDCNPSKGIIFTSAKSHVFSGLYTEWSHRNFVISRFAYTSGNWNASLGLSIDRVSQYKDNANNFILLTFEDGCFGYYDAKTGQYVPSATFIPNPAAHGVRAINIGSPVRDMGAFLHGGYDFKYGTYNLNATVGTSDFDILRDVKQSKEFLTPNGLLVNKSPIMFPFKSPAKDSMVHIWIKDLTGNFDANNFSMWLTAAIETTTTNNNDFVAYGEIQVDFGNGYKLLTLLNKRHYANDGVSTWSPQQCVYLNMPTTSNTPIIIKAIECYTGGLTIWPQGCDYIPQSDLTANIASNVYAAYSNGMGGGIFKPGDIINPYISVDKHNQNFKFSPIIGTTYSAYTKIVKSGLTLDAALKVTFNATITAVDNTNSQTTVSIPAASVPYMGMGIPLWIVSGSSTSVTGSQRLVSRVLNSDGTLSGNYVIDGVVGAVGDALNIDQSQIPAYVFYPFESLNVSGNSQIGNDNAVALFGVNGDIGFVKKSGANGKLAISSTNIFSITVSPNKPFAAADTFTDVFTVGSTGIVTFMGNVVPKTTASLNIGSSSATVNNLYLQNAATIVSDERYKSLTQAIPEEILDLWGTLNFQMWKLNAAVDEKGLAAARYHFGLIAQDITRAFEKAGLDWTQYGLVTYEAWPAIEGVEAQPEVLDEEGNILQPAVEEVLAQPAGDIYMLRMEECFAVEAAYQRRKDARTDAILAQLLANNTQNS